MRVLIGILFLFPLALSAADRSSSETVLPKPEVETRFLSKPFSVVASIGSALDSTFVPHYIGAVRAAYFPSSWLGATIGSDFGKRRFEGLSGSQGSVVVADYADVMAMASVRSGGIVRGLDVVASSLGAFYMPKPFELARVPQTTDTIGIVLDNEAFISLAPRSEWGVFSVGVALKYGVQNALVGANDSFFEMSLRVGLGGVL